MGWDPARNITFLNQAFEKMSGWTEASLMAEGVESLFPEGECYQSLRAIEKTAVNEYWERIRFRFCGETIKHVRCGGIWQRSTLKRATD